jgi:hypothetical protein
VSDAQRAGPAFVAIVVLALAMAGCQGEGGSSPSLAAASHDAATASAPPTANHWSEATGVPTTSPGASSGATASASSAAASMDDPDITLALPEGWREVPIATYRFLVATAAEGAPVSVRPTLLAHVADIDAGRVRLAALGPPGMPQQAASVTFQVDSGDASLAAAMSRIERLALAIAPSDTEDRRAVSLPIGDAIRIVTTHNSESIAPAGTWPSRAVQYVIRLHDGRTLWIDAVAPVEYEAMVAHVDASVATLRAR